MKFILLLSVLFLFACQIKPQNREENIKRIALVIGNQNYKENPLKNPINDALGMKKVLEKIGFDVTLKKDITLSEFHKALKDIKGKIEPNKSIVFFYFAGHGNTLKHRSSEEFLLMTDREKKVLVSIYTLYDFLNKAEARYNIVVIDACRDYQKNYLPVDQKTNQDYIHIAKNYRGNFRANIRVGRGKLKNEFIIHDDNASDSFPKSTIISYATMHNQLAQDWSLEDREHSPYTRQLIKYIDDEEIPIEEVFRRIRIALIHETNRSQINLEESSLEKNIWLVPKQGKVAFAPPI